MPYTANFCYIVIMIIKRDSYLKQLIAKKDNGRIKVITGIRRCGKSFLLFSIFRNFLKRRGVKDSQIIVIKLDEKEFAQYRNPFELDKFIRGKIKGRRRFYIFIDEIQFVETVPNPWLKGADSTIGFVDVLLGLMKIENVDIYVTGSNSKMLSSDVVTQFRDRGDEIRIAPLTFSEFLPTFKGPQEDAWREYYTYGGLPRLPSLKTHREKSEYLQKLFSNTYIRDVVERHDIRNSLAVLDDLVNTVASAVGSLTNPKKLSDTFKSNGIAVEPNTISEYMRHLEEGFILEHALRYDVKGKKYISTPMKFYFTDVGLRNARLNFRQQEENHIMENIIYNELKKRGFSVDVGVVEYRHVDSAGKDVRTQLEVDFIARGTNKIFYIQSALNIDGEKRDQEINSLKRISDSFMKIVVVKDNIMPWHDDNGFLYIGIRDFLLKPEIMGDAD